jgi:hypothetical protein
MDDNSLDTPKQSVALCSSHSDLRQSQRWASRIPRVVFLISLDSTEKETGNVYIMMEARLSALFKSEEEYQILEKSVQVTISF